jgi:hypothetical protein
LSDILPASAIAGRLSVDHCATQGSSMRYFRLRTIAFDTWSRDVVQKSRNTALLIIAAIFLLFLISLFTPFYHEVCEKNQYTGHNDCATYHMAIAWLWYIGKYGNEYGVFASAIATMAIAIFTWTLWRATTEQGRLTRQSIEVANKSIELGRQEFAATHRPKIFVQSITMNFLNDNNWECRLGFFIANGGDTDATVIGYVADPYWHEEPRFFAPESAEGQFNFLNDIIIPPGGRFEITSDHVFDIREPGFSRAILFAIGRVEYRGADQARRLTGFCREYINHTRMWQTVQNDAYEYTY